MRVFDYVIGTFMAIGLGLALYLVYMNMPVEVAPVVEEVKKEPEVCTPIYIIVEPEKTPKKGEYNT